MITGKEADDVIREAQVMGDHQLISCINEIRVSCHKYRKNPDDDEAVRLPLAVVLYTLGVRFLYAEIRLKSKKSVRLFL